VKENKKKININKNELNNIKEKNKCIFRSYRRAYSRENRKKGKITC